MLEGQTARLSGRALETLAIVAYKQPISRAQMSAIRGVNVDATLTHAACSAATSKRSATTPAPGDPAVLYGTTTPVPRAARPRLARRPARRSATSCPSAELVEALERGLRVARSTSDAGATVESEPTDDDRVDAATEPDA